MKTFSIQGPRRGSRSLPWFSLALVAAAVAAFVFAGPAPGAWVFDRLAIEQGEWWRLVTGHWVHSDRGHAAWNIAALGLFGILFEAQLRWRLPLVLLVSAFAVDAWLWWGDPALRYYCGLSGILNGLLILGLAELWRGTRHPLVLLTAAGAALKIIVEIQGGQALLTRTDWPSVPEVHAAGFICGLVAACILQIRFAPSAVPFLMRIQGVAYLVQSLEKAGTYRIAPVVAPQQGRRMRRTQVFRVLPALYQLDRPFPKVAGGALPLLQRLCQRGMKTQGIPQPNLSHQAGQAKIHQGIVGVDGH